MQPRRQVSDIKEGATIVAISLFVGFMVLGAVVCVIFMGVAISGLNEAVTEGTKGWPR
jgi:hypothetical protein